MRTLIQHATLVTASDTFHADLLIEGEKIAQIGLELPTEGATVVDASDRYLLPGAIDVHTHLELPMMGTCSSDDFYTGHKAAAFGGVTSHIDFASQAKGGSLAEGVATWQAKAAGKAVIDYGFHMTISDPRPEVIEEIPQMVEAGITTIKLLLAYKGRLQVDDTALFQVLRKTAAHGMLTMVHAENGDAIEILIEEAVAEGHLSPEWHARTRPHWTEAEATLRAIALAAAANAPLYVVHMTCQSAVEQLNYGRAKGLPVMGETCTQYLFFTADHLRRGDGAKWVCSPPMRTTADNEFLWQSLRRGDLQVVATDHCPFFVDGTRPIDYEGTLVAIAGKELGRSNFTLIPNGVPGLQDRLPILWSYGVNTGRITPNRLVELCCTNPAKIFGLYPRKGTLAVGADADLVIWNPNQEKIMGIATSHQRTDYNLYEGMKVRGWPERVYRRGELLVHHDQWLGQRGSGKYLPRTPYAPIL